MNFREVTIDGVTYLQFDCKVYVPGAIRNVLFVCIEQVPCRPLPSEDDAVIAELVDSNVKRHGHQKVIDTLIDIAVEP